MSCVDDLTDKVVGLIKLPIYRLLGQGGHKPWKPGILRDFSEHEKLWEFCATSGKYLCKTAVDWVNRIIRNRDDVRVRWWPFILLELMCNDPWWMSLLHLLFVVIACGKVSLWLWKSLEKSGNFFILCGHPVRPSQPPTLRGMGYG